LKWNEKNIFFNFSLIQKEKHSLIGPRVNPYILYIPKSGQVYMKKKRKIERKKIEATFLELSIINIAAKILGPSFSS